MKIKVFCNTCDLSENLFDVQSCYNFYHKYIRNEKLLSESLFNIENFKRFIEIVKEVTEKGDNRPVYIFDFFERLDESTDVTQFIDMLYSLDRQVFISISGGYHIERLKKYAQVQIL